MSKSADFFVWRLFQQLRRERFPLSPEDYQGLRDSLRAGMGWSSRAALCELCCSLWAKSLEERETVRRLFEQLAPLDWELKRLFPEQPETLPPDGPTDVLEPSPSDLPEPSPSDLPGPSPSDLPPSVSPMVHREVSQATSAEIEEMEQRLPPISFSLEVPVEKGPFILRPEYPLTSREVAQIWRSLRQTVRVGPATELDVAATISKRVRQGVASGVVLRPRRRNRIHLLLLVDRDGSMEPFHAFVELVCDAIKNSGRLAKVSYYYFHNTPVEGADEMLLAPHHPFPTLDRVLPQIEPLSDGDLFHDPELFDHAPLASVLKEEAVKSLVVIISDAGAARGHYNVLRLLNTVAFVKALHHLTERYVWLNPLPRAYWTHSTAAQIARHVPMFPFSRTGMYRAVNLLRGHPYAVEKGV